MAHNMHYCGQQGTLCADCKHKQHRGCVMPALFTPKTTAGLLLAVGLGAATSASATVFSFDINNPPGSTSAGDVTHFSASYNDASQHLSWSSTIARQSGNLADGFWLVLSDGPNPKSHYNEYAIFYGDGNTGNLTSYVYNGVNSASSWNTPGEFIQSFAGGLTVDNSVADEVTFSFSIDVSAINAYTPTTPGTNDWDGAAFAEKIGIWYHPVVFGGSGPSYNADGSLASFPVARNGWYDTSNQMTMTVPEPAMALLMLTGLLGVISVRRRRT